MAALDYALASELAVGADHPTMQDIINRPLKSVLLASGLAIAVDPFPGFLPLSGGTRIITSLTLTEGLTGGAATDITINTDRFIVNATTGNVEIGGTLDVSGDFAIASVFTVAAGSGNTVISGTLKNDGAWACNAATPQTPVALTALIAYSAGAAGYTNGAMAQALYERVQAIETALVNVGILSH